MHSPHLSVLTSAGARNEKYDQRLSERSLRTRQSQSEGQNPDSRSTQPRPSQLPATLEQQNVRVLNKEVPEPPAGTVLNNESKVSHNQSLAPNHSNQQNVRREADSDRLENRVLRDNLKALQEDIQMLRKDNDLLRASIVEKGKDAQPRRGEEHYARLFKELRVDIEAWMAKQAKANGSQELAETVERAILDKLAAFGIRGQWSADFLTTNRIFHTWYLNTRSRIQLGRHIIAAILFDQVFVPFAFGLPEEWAHALAWVERDINVRGRYPLTWHLLIFRGAIRSGSYGSSIAGVGSHELRAATPSRRRTYSRCENG